MRKSIIIFLTLVLLWTSFAAVTENNNPTIDYWVGSGPYPAWYKVEGGSGENKWTYLLSTYRKTKTHHVWVIRSGLLYYYENGEPCSLWDGLSSLLEIMP